MSCRAKYGDVAAQLAEASGVPPAAGRGGPYWLRPPRGNPTLAMATPPAGEEKQLSCGHTVRATVSAGGEEWCSQCDDWSTVAGLAVAAALPLLPGNIGPGQAQLWSELELAAKNHNVRLSDHPVYLLYAPGKGRVYGGFYGQGKDGTWYRVMAWGPAGAAKARVQPAFCSPWAREVPGGREAGARDQYYAKHYEKRRTGYTPTWPDDGPVSPLVRCATCGTFYSEKAACHLCQPAKAKLAASLAARKGG